MSLLGFMQNIRHANAKHDVGCPECAEGRSIGKLPTPKWKTKAFNMGIYKAVGQGNHHQYVQLLLYASSSLFNVSSPQSLCAWRCTYCE